MYSLSYILAQLVWRAETLTAKRPVLWFLGAFLGFTVLVTVVGGWFAIISGFLVFNWICVGVAVNSWRRAKEREELAWIKPEFRRAIRDWRRRQDK